MTICQQKSDFKISERAAIFTEENIGPALGGWAENLQATLKHSLECENPLILDRYMQEYGGSLAQAQNAFIAVAQFLYTAALVEGCHGLSEQIDEMWHIFILFTRDYRDFCERHFGRFIDHVPTSEPGSVDGYQWTRSNAERLFGPLNGRMWPVMEEAVACQGRPVPCSAPGRCNPKCNPTCHPVPLP